MMKLTPAILPELIMAISQTIEDNIEMVTALDQAIGDGDHVINLQRGLNALQQEFTTLADLTWGAAFQKIGVTLLSTMGGASGSLLGTLFITMGKTAQNVALDLNTFPTIFTAGVEAVKKRGQADVGDKTLLDVLIPVEKALQLSLAETISMAERLTIIVQTSEAGVEATREMIALKGRAAFMGERSRGHLDAGAKTSQLMICAIIKVLKSKISETLK
jgi:dihydroxyacetone kinase-like protein